ncbi:hypothetical protein [Leptospira adleri]|uniref:Uncharacterized protein n=1 Tax=Leptospira adleri TaxID=2023186 RepID=A0A2M9YIB1_9LEPT|nr:hypothetical protein [Leptospira adleri]PJZ51236.1 hypothetical protein CH380_21080 [Leptospira adleri]PJZ59741.1 hypothetical protein CH376_22190 [Leptospira adleri]
MEEQDSKKEKGSAFESAVSKQKLGKNELIKACIKIANMKKPMAEITRILKPLGIPYYTVYHVFIGKSNRPEVLDIFTKLGIPHDRKPIRALPKKHRNDE